MTHPELKQPREGAGRRGADDEALQDAETRMRLHDPLELQDRFARHQAVAVERQEERIVPAPAPHEVADIAGLPAGALLAPPVAGVRA